MNAHPADSPPPVSTSEPLRDGPEPGGTGARTPLISLCLIVGNVEEYIERCLSSFAPIADEIVVVRAIGCAEPDDTLDIAREKFGAITGEYRNATGHEDWPHVDDFAKARQAAYDLATGTYCFWCDTDDILLSGAELIREHAERGAYTCFMFPYAIHGKGLAVPRERMMLRGSGKWVCPVHEHYEFTIQPVQAIEDERVVIQHLPHHEKTGSNDRNLRILRSIPDAEMTTGLLYHLHIELCVIGDIAGSVEVAKKVLARDDLGKPERMELFLNLAQVSEDPRQKEALYYQAYASDPRRREPLLMLCNHAMNNNEPDVALAFARQMMATDRPAAKEWNERAALYEWLGDDIYAQALRANRMYPQAEIVRQNRFKQHGGARIALIHATRGRPKQAALARKVWLDTASRPECVEHIFVFDTDDTASHCLRRFHHSEMPAGGGCVAAWNRGAGVTHAPVIVQMSDDWTPPHKWDDLIIERIGDPFEPRVLAVSDGHRTDLLLCMAICTRKFITESDAFLFHPWFTGVYSDNWFTHKAYERGAVIEARDLVFKHHHPAFGADNMDATYEQQNAPARYEEGKAIFDELMLGNDWSTVPGWFNYYGFYGSIAKRLQDGDTIAEVGVWMGRSIIFMAQTLKRLGKRVKLIAVDTFQGEAGQVEHVETVAAHGGSIRAAFEANVKRCGVADMIQVIEGDSADSAALIADGSLAFCYIDAAHEYDGVKRDILAWKGKVKPGGIFAGHDAQHPPVMKAVEELFPDVKVMHPCWIQPL